MKKISIYKVAQVLSIIVSFMVMIAPFTALGQFHIPDSGPAGLPGTFNGANNLTSLILSIINIILAVAGLIAVLILIIGGFRYVTSFGNEEAVKQAKGMIINAIIGIVIIILSFVIVRVVSNVALHPNNI